MPRGKGQKGYKWKCRKVRLTIVESDLSLFICNAKGSSIHCIMAFKQYSCCASTKPTDLDTRIHFEGMIFARVIVDNAKQWSILLLEDDILPYMGKLILRTHIWRNASHNVVYELSLYPDYVTLWSSLTIDFFFLVFFMRSRTVTDLKSVSFGYPLMRPSSEEGYFILRKTKVFRE